MRSYLWPSWAQNRNCTGDETPFIVQCTFFFCSVFYILQHKSSVIEWESWSSHVLSSLVSKLMHLRLTKLTKKEMDRSHHVTFPFFTWRNHVLTKKTETTGGTIMICRCFAGSPDDSYQNFSSYLSFSSQIVEFILLQDNNQIWRTSALCKNVIM